MTGRRLRMLTLLPACIALNIVMGQVVAVVKLPLYLDSVGTVLAAVLLGAGWGAVTGGLGTVLWGLMTGPTILPFALTAAAVGALAGGWARVGAFRYWPATVLAGTVTGVVAAALSAPIAAVLYGGVTGGGTDLLVALGRAAGHTVLMSTFYQSLAVDPVDKAISFLLVWTVVQALPQRYRVRFA